jgi:hypothetical protein
MAWIESHEDIWEHHKIIRLCSAVNQPDYAVVGRLHSMWHFVLRNAWRTSNLEPWGDDGIERASRWDGEKGAWVKALRDCGFLDGYIVHGWQEKAGRLVEDRRRNERRKNGGKTAVKRTHTAGKSVATVPNPTVPNPTKDNGVVVSANGAGNDPPKSSASPPKPTPADLIALWNERAHPSLPRVRVLSEAMRNSARARLEKNPEPKFWVDVIQTVNDSPLCRGEVNKRDGGKPWRASFEWILNPTNLAKILNGNYR